jgi:hypothetical protein
MDPIAVAIDRIEDARRLVAVCAAALRSDPGRGEDAALILQRYVDGELAEVVAELRTGK